FGSPMPGRNFNASNYRYGYNGKENDNEVKGTGNSLDFGARVHDPRLGRFLSTDPLSTTYPSISPYCFAANDPIRFIDVDGKGPGDRVIIFTGNILIPFIQQRTPTMDQLYKGVGKNGADVTMYNTYRQVTDAAFIKSAVNEVLQSRKANPNNTIIIFGYSYGGVVAQKVAAELKKQNVEVKLLVTLDAANGTASDEINRVIPSNVKTNKNYYETNKPNSGVIEKVLDSNGAANCAEDCDKTDVQNFDMSKTQQDGKPVDHYNIDDKMINTIINDINDAEPKAEPKK
ncbi:MAG: hypothetical protein IM592_17295, partial [Bacteroidetes bacterium]|nr:hypothetical protein [Bacteroidota bacterium]